MTQYDNQICQENDEKNRGGGGYQNHYPENDTTHQENALFYKGIKSSQTEGGFITKVHKDFFGDYDMLEERHNYIQWFFPIRESGMANVQPLTKNEALQFQNSKEMQDNLIKNI